jgi:hypothetical protein
MGGAIDKTWSMGDVGESYRDATSVISSVNILNGPYPVDCSWYSNQFVS